MRWEPSEAAWKGSCGSRLLLRTPILTFVVVQTALAWVLCGLAMGQGTAFTYQGKLVDNNVAANGNYDFEFRLYDTAGVGTGIQQGPAIQRLNVNVVNGLFTVSLDFGACAICFTGADRFLEIGVKQTSGSTFTTLAPRQPISSTPYALKSLSAGSADGLSVMCVNCITSSQIGSVNGSAVTGAIPVTGVPSGSGNYIQNTTSQQAATNFNISGDGTAAGILSASIMDAGTHYNLAGLPILSVTGPYNFSGRVFTASNTFVGENAGQNTSPDPSITAFFGKLNSFFGAGAGKTNTTGYSNSYFGVEAGSSNTTGNLNSFFGDSAGKATTTAVASSFFGAAAGARTTTGSFNDFFGNSTGSNNTTGFANSFFGSAAGFLNTTGSSNAFFGTSAGSSNFQGDRNTLIGNNANFSASNTVGSDNTSLGFTASVTANLSNATAIGSRALVEQSNALVLGSINGVNGSTASTNVGIGTTMPSTRLHVVGNGLFTGNLTINGTLSANLPGGSSNYVQNTALQQAAANFNISGDGTAGGMLKGNIVSATSQFNIGAQRILSIGSSSIYIGSAAGTTGGGNSFVGSNSGQLNTSGNFNSFFGGGSGDSNATGNNNTFIGAEAHATGINSTGDNNSVLGAFATVSNGLNYAIAIGARASVTQSNSLVLGAINGVNGGSANTSVGIGTTAPGAPLHIASGESGTVPNANATLIVDSSAGHFVNILGPDISQTGVLFGKPTGGGSVAGIVFNNSGVTDGLQFRTGGSASTRLAITSAGDVGIGTSAPSDKLHVNGVIRVSSLGAAGSTNLCRNASDQIATCSSSLRYKTDIAPFSGGLDVVNRLRPISFTWKESGIRDVGFGAEDVARVAPLFTFTNDKDEIEGVKYDRIGVVLVNAIKEQQEQIGQQQSQIKTQETMIRRQQIQIDALQKIVCLDHPNADFCR
jgi:hypothetical protein